MKKYGFTYYFNQGLIVQVFEHEHEARLETFLLLPVGCDIVYEGHLAVRGYCNHFAGFLCKVG